MSLLGAIVAGGSALVGAGTSLFSSSKNYNAQKQANATNLQIARENNKANLALWREQSKYNSPSEYMKRLEDAGLNPQLAYGNLSNTFASSPPTMQGATMQAPNLQLGNIAQSVGMFYEGKKLEQEIAESKSRVSLNNFQQNALEADMIYKESLNQYYGAQTNNLRFDNQMKRDLRETYYDILRSQLEQAKESISKTRHENTLLQVQRSLTSKQIAKLSKEISHIDSQITEQNARNVLWKAGINPNSHGLDKLVDMLVTNPNELSNILLNAQNSVADATGTMFKPSNWGLWRAMRAAGLGRFVPNKYNWRSFGGRF